MIYIIKKIYLINKLQVNMLLNLNIQKFKNVIIFVTNFLHTS